MQLYGCCGDSYAPGRYASSMYSTAGTAVLYLCPCGLLHVWEAELHDRWFSRASRELGVPLTAARGIATSAHPDSCTRALCAGAGIQVRRQTGNALERGRYTGFANRLPGAGMAGAR